MSTQVERRITRLERLNAPEIAADKRDPKLVDLLQQIYGDDFPADRVPLGVSCAAFLDEVMAGLSGRVIGPAAALVGGD